MHALGRTLAVAALAVACAGCADPLPPAPAQPIRFSHKVHAGDNGIGCTYCHAFVEKGPVAGIPSMARCQGCHKFVKVDQEQPGLTAEIALLLKQLEDQKPVPWLRVHRLPDHVYFTHQRHVVSGVQCRECHGEVERMEVVRQVAPLTMGWCLECHKRKQAERPLERAHLTDCLNCHK
jgi:hypothetical protein